MGTYAAYPVIDKYMIAPYAVEDTEEFVYLKDRSNENESEEYTTSEDVDSEAESINEKVEEKTKKADFTNKNKKSKKAKKSNKK